MAKVVPVILCGGSGTRLWPRSRNARPKPFLQLLGCQTPFEEALERSADDTLFDAPLIVVGESHFSAAFDQAHKLAPSARFIVEPIGRNTAPAVALAAHLLDPEDVMLVCPSDHYIGNRKAFRKAAESAATLARKGNLVAFGIEACEPETGYGYLKRGRKLSPGYWIDSFIEKPELDRAQQFLADGGYTWNGGIFAFKAGVFLDELSTHRPSMAAAVHSAVERGDSGDKRFEPDAEAFALIDGESIDYAVMENTERAAMVDVNMDWSDIGSWDALRKLRHADSNGNIAHGRGEFVDTANSMIDTDGPRVSVIGLNDIIVIVDGDEILVVSGNSVQKVGELAKLLQN